MNKKLAFSSCYSLDEIEDNFYDFNFFDELVKSLGEAKMKNNLYCCCNLCGKEFNIWDYEENFQIHTLLGYGTAYDGNELHLRLCCDCMTDIIDSCYYSPILEIEYDTSEEDEDEMLMYLIESIGNSIRVAWMKLKKRVSVLLSNIHIKTNK